MLSLDSSPAKVSASLDLFQITNSNRKSQKLFPLLADTHRRFQTLQDWQSEQDLASFFATFTLTDQSWWNISFSMLLHLFLLKYRYLLIFCFILVFLDSKRLALKPLFLQLLFYLADLMKHNIWKASGRGFRDNHSHWHHTEPIGETYSHASDFGSRDYWSETSGMVKITIYQCTYATW